LQRISRLCIGRTIDALLGQRHHRFQQGQLVAQLRQQVRVQGVSAHSREVPANTGFHRRCSNEVMTTQLRRA
jgi:hypothetical protein